VHDVSGGGAGFAGYERNRAHANGSTDSKISDHVILPDNELPGLRDFLAIEAWADRQMPEPDRLLGDLLTTTSRMFLVGRTGLGKTMLGFGMACGIAAGDGFLHWRSVRPARVLYIDGEMPGELIKSRSIDVLRRAANPPAPGQLLIYSSDTEDEFAKLFPTLGRMPPLNSEAGLNFLSALIAKLGGVDVVIFDNVMSLIGGDQKDEIPWTETLPLVSSLTSKRIGQVWLDHTGHNTDRQYGSATKAWRMDAVGVMTPLSDDQRDRHEVAFSLSFEHPGKARRRTPDNWADFETCTIRLKDDRWSSAPVGGRGGPTLGKVSPARQVFYQALVSAIGKGADAGRTLVESWELECSRRGLIEAAPEGVGPEPWRSRDARYRNFRKGKSDLLGAGWIAIEGNRVIDLRGRWG
jgi:hypothetical protein